MTKKTTTVWWGLGGTLVVLLLIWWWAPGLVTMARDLTQIVLSGDYQAFVDYVRSFGWQGMVILFVLQAIETATPVFPETLLELAAGVTYGPVWGTLTLATSYILFNIIIFQTLRRWSIQLPARWASCKPVNRLQKMLHHQKAEVVVFVLYLFPFMSNCFVPFLAAQTDITFRRYVLIMMISCLPLMIVCVYLGDRLLAQDWLMAGLASSLGVGVSVALYFAQSHLEKWLTAGRST